jgi:hypothetical protein
MSRSKLYVLVDVLHASLVLYIINKYLYLIYIYKPCFFFIVNEFTEFYRSKDNPIVNELVVLIIFALGRFNRFFRFFNESLTSIHIH